MYGSKEIAKEGSVHSMRDRFKGRTKTIFFELTSGSKNTGWMRTIQFFNPSSTGLTMINIGILPK